MYAVKNSIHIYYGVYVVLWYNIQNNRMGLKPDSDFGNTEMLYERPIV